MEYSFEYSFSWPGMLLSLAITVFMIVAMWKIYVKANWPGWASLIPIYNVYAMLKIAGKPGWWLLLFFVPIVNIIIAIISLVAFSKSFGKSGWYALGLILLGIVFFPVLAFGNAEYIGSE
ncbi:MAG: DUF5684 domain-containing protein [Candidatus Theseobacter exili]|nr:DUF5684 domain-containing protein [Candidatus Theseobacter exili]